LHIGRLGFPMLVLLITVKFKENVSSSPIPKDIF
jgi:hypothetical protein